MKYQAFIIPLKTWDGESAPIGDIVPLKCTNTQECNLILTKIDSLVGNKLTKSEKLKVLRKLYQLEVTIEH